MTSSRNALILVIAAVISVGAGVWLASRQSSSSSGERAQLYPELMKQLDAVQSVTIFKAGDAPAVEIARKGGVWGVAQRAGYPADETRLRTLLRALADAKALEEKTSNPANYKSLGVEDVKEADASGIRIELAGAATSVNLIVGKGGPGGRSHYVRKAGEPQSWLIDVSLDASAAPESWLRKEIIDVSADRVQAATVAGGGAKAYTAAKASRADANFTVSDLPKGKKLSAPSAANSLATALTGLTLTDVQAADAFAGAPAAARATYTTFDGLVVELEGWARDDKHYVAVKPSYDGKVAERFKVPTAASDAKSNDAKPDAADATSAAKPVEPRKPNVEGDAKTIGGRTSGWIYQIPSYKYEQIFKAVDELVAS
jgi:hypothetical protein